MSKSNTKGWSKSEWKIILPIKLQIRKELKNEGFKLNRGKYGKRFW